MDTIQKIKGFADLFPPESGVFSWIESTAREIFSRYGYRELRIPVLERTELFSRSIGEETDVVQKEMYTFPDRKGRSLTLRPEATAGVMGTPEFASTVLGHILASEAVTVAAVYTQPDRPCGRGKKCRPGPVKLLALDRGLPVHQPATFKDPAAVATLAAYAPDVLLVAAYGMAGRPLRSINSPTCRPMPKLTAASSRA